MQYILGHCINQSRQTPDIAAPPSASSPLFVLSGSLFPPPPSSLPLLMLIILSVLPASPGIAPCLSFSLLTFTRCWIQTHIRVLLFARCATRPLTMLQTGSLSSLLSLLEIAPSRSAQIPSRLRLMVSLHKQSCRYTCAPLFLRVRLVFNIRRSVKNNHKGIEIYFGDSAKQSLRAEKKNTFKVHLQCRKSME